MLSLSAVGCGSAESTPTNTNLTPAAPPTNPGNPALQPPNTFGPPTGSKPGSTPQNSSEACSPDMKAYVHNFTNRTMTIADPIYGNSTSHDANVNVTVDEKNCLKVAFSSPDFGVTFSYPFYTVANAEGLAFRTAVFKSNPISSTDMVTFELVYPYMIDQVSMRFVSCGMTGSNALFCGRNLDNITFTVKK